jgi:hypothetical protein
MKDVFISYNHKDQAAKNWLRAILDRHNISYFLDSNDLELGKDISQGLIESMQNSRYNIMLVSQHSLFSVWVGMEAMFRIREEGVRQVPSLLCIVIDNTVLERDFPIKVQAEFKKLEQELEELRTRMRELGGDSQVYDIEINRLKRVNVSDLMIKVRKDLMLQCNNLEIQDSDVNKLVAKIKGGPPAVEEDAGFPWPINWEDLKEAMLKEKAILFLGPEVTVNYEDRNNQEKFFNNLVAKYGGGGPMGIKTYHERDGLLVFNEPGGRNGHQNNIRQFYLGTQPAPNVSHQFSSSVLQKLAEIPFKMVINTSPDNSFQAECEQRGFGFTHTFPFRPPYAFTPAIPITGQTPLIYGLLGSVVDAGSLILTHQDLFRLMEKVFQQGCFAQALKMAFPEGDYTHLVFLGFDFDKWYFQLLLQILDIEPKKLVAPPASNHARFDVQTEQFYESHFKINFVRSGIPQFVNHLHGLFDKRQLRRPHP